MPFLYFAILLSLGLLMLLLGLVIWYVSMLFVALFVTPIPFIIAGIGMILSLFVAWYAVQTLTFFLDKYLPEGFWD